MTQNSLGSTHTAQGDHRSNTRARGAHHPVDTLMTETYLYYYSNSTFGRSPDITVDPLTLRPEFYLLPFTVYCTRTKMQNPANHLASKCGSLSPFSAPFPHGHTLTAVHGMSTPPLDRNKSATRANFNRRNHTSFEKTLRHKAEKHLNGGQFELLFRPFIDGIPVASQENQHLHIFRVERTTPLVHSQPRS